MHPPSSLIEWQERFGKVLLGKLPPNTIKPKHRMEIYTGSYEAKLVSAIQFHFPSLPLLIGREKFPSLIATPYLRKNPPQDWSTESFTRGIVKWIEKEGLFRLSPLLLPLAETDLAFLNAHFPLERQGCLRDEVQVILTPYPVIELRKALLQQQPLPSYEKKKRGFVIFSDEKGKLYSREVDPLHGKLLQLMTEHPLERALELLVQDRTLPLDSLESDLHTWSAMWGEQRWIEEKKLS